MIANLGRSLSVAVNSGRSKGTPLCHAKSLEIKVLIAGTVKILSQIDRGGLGPALL